MIDDKKTFCCYCGRLVVSPLRLTAEHLIPLSKGGNNSTYNKRPCCHSCNNWRCNKPLCNFLADVKRHLLNGIRKAGYSSADLEAMIENIDYCKRYVETSKGRLLKDSINIKPKR